MKFSYKWLKERISNIPKPSSVVDLLEMHAFEVESIQKEGDDFIFDIDILPNRISDCSGHRGLAKEISAIAGLKFKDKEPRLVESAEVTTKDAIEIKITDKGCVLYNARVLDNIKVGTSPKWLRMRLEAIGINSINNIVDAANYVMLDTGQPLHVFDYDKLVSKRKSKKLITVRGAKKEEHFLSLDKEQYKLSVEDIVIADDKSAIAIAGIKGGKRPEVDQKTKIIVLESATFSRGRIRSTSQRLNLITDSSRRFGAGLDPNLSKKAIDELAVLIQKIAEGRIYSGALSIGHKFPEIKQIIFSSDKARSVLGANIPDDEIKNIFTGLGFGIKPKIKNWVVEVPSVRKDIEIEEDLIEEVGRIYGYKKIKPVRARGEVVSAKIDQDIFFREKIRDMARSVGFDEVRLYSFVGEKELSLLSLDARKNVLELKNPSRSEYKYLRPKLTPSILMGLSEALKYADNPMFFEIGRVYRKPELKPAKDTPDLERSHIAFAVGNRIKDEESFLEMKGRIDAFFESLGLNDVWYDDSFQTPDEVTGGIAYMLHPYRFAEIKRGNKILGIVGEIHPDIRDSLKLKGSVSICELNLSVLLSEIESEKEYRPISRYPAVMRDLALFVPAETKIVNVQDIIENIGGQLLVDVDLFDIYEGEEVPEGKKNLAFKFVFQSHDKTLSDEEVKKVMDKIIKALENSDPSWEVRK